MRALAGVSAVIFGVVIWAVAACAQDYSIQGTAYGDIYFGTGSAELGPDAKKTLDELYGLMTVDELYATGKKSPGSVLLLAGYDDRRTPRDESVALGWKRADAVRGYLISLGADPEGIKTISFGNTKGVVQGDGEDAWSRERRVRYRLTPPVNTEKVEGKPAGVCQRCKK